MKLLTLCVICGFLTTSSSVAYTLTGKDSRDSSDESSEYSDLFGDAIKGVQALLGNAIDDDSDNDSESNESKIDSGFLQQVLNKINDNDREEIEAILNAIDLIFSETLLNLEKIAKEAVDEFVQSLQDLDADLNGSKEMEESTSQAAIGTEMQQSNSQNSQKVEASSTNGEQHKIKQTEKGTNGNNVGVTVKTVTHHSSWNNSKKIEETVNSDEQKKTEGTEMVKNENSDAVAIPEIVESANSTTDEKQNSKDENDTSKKLTTDDENKLLTDEDADKENTENGSE